MDLDIAMVVLFTETIVGRSKVPEGHDIRDHISCLGGVLEKTQVAGMWWKRLDCVRTELRGSLKSYSALAPMLE